VSCGPEQQKTLAVAQNVPEHTRRPAEPPQLRLAPRKASKALPTAATVTLTGVKREKLRHHLRAQCLGWFYKMSRDGDNNVPINPSIGSRRPRSLSAVRQADAARAPKRRAKPAKGPAGRAEEDAAGSAQHVPAAPAAGTDAAPIAGIIAAAAPADQAMASASTPEIGQHPAPAAAITVVPDRLAPPTLVALLDEHVSRRSLVELHSHLLGMGSADFWVSRIMATYLPRVRVATEILVRTGTRSPSVGQICSRVTK
jgi:hypothetical protein